MRRYGRIIRLAAVLLLAAAMALQVPVSAFNDNVSFSDVPADGWYAEYVQKCAWLEIINGYGDGTFKPDQELKRGEFIKMLAVATELYTTKNSTSVHWAAPYWNMLSEAGVLEDVNIACTYSSLEQSITRYEMAVLLRNALYNVLGENTMEVESPETNIGDYSVISMAYRSAVEQAYGKGILCGIDSNGSFGGNYNLTRAQAAKVIVLLLWPSERQAVSFATEVTSVLEPEDSFSFRYRSMSVAERRLALFGDANKTYFTSASDAGSHIVGVSIKYWNLKSDGVTWYTVTQTIYVNTVVVDEVTAIFDDLYNLPMSQRFPIYYVGGARYTDTLRHSWGCALDINANHNYYLNYVTGQQVGTYCHLNSSSAYCIKPGSALVQIFAKYGWGWGGEGWTSAVDYMHFSILASGG